MNHTNSNKYYIYTTGDDNNDDQLPFAWNRYAWVAKKTLDFPAMAKAAD